MRDFNTKFSPDEMLVAILVLSIFISLYATIAAMIVIIGYLVWQNQLKNIIDSVRGVQYLILFYVLTVLVSVANANFQGVLATVAIAMIFMVAIYVRQVMTRQLFEKIIDISCAASLFGFVVVIIQFLNFMQDPEYRADSTFMNPNYYAAITELVVIFALYRLLKPGAKSKRYLILVAVCNFCGLLLSDCRSALIALGVACLLLLFLNKNYKILGWSIAALSVTVLSIAIFPAIFPRAGSLSVDLDFRMSIWMTALRGILAHPALGQGFGTYQLIYARYAGPIADHTHNLLLEPLLNFGIIGTFLLVLYFRANLQAVRRLHKSRTDRQVAYLVYAILCCVVIHGMTDIVFFSVQTGLLLFLALASAGIVEHPAPAPTKFRTVSDILYADKKATPRNRSL